MRTAGAVQGRETGAGVVTWNFVAARPCGEIGFAAGPYAVISEDAPRGRAVDAYVPAGREDGARKLLRAAEGALAYYADLYGPLEDADFSLVAMPAAFGAASGYGESGYALIGEAAFDQADEAPWATRLIAHEVAHAWWGRAVGFSDFANEMLATYATLRWLEHAQGPDAARRERQRMIRAVAEVATEHGLVALDTIRGWSSSNSRSHSACAYDKAALLLHALERELGRETFDQRLRTFFDRHRGQTVGYADVAQALGGTRQRWVFEQWQRAELPRLQVEHEATPKGKRFQVRGSVVQESVEKPYRMTVTLRAMAGEEIHDHEVKLRKASTDFRFTLPFHPERLRVDPDGHLSIALKTEIDVEALTQAIFAIANSPKAGDRADLERTLANIQRVLDSGQVNPSVYHTAEGRCAFRLGELERAKRAFAKALESGAGGPFHRTWIHLRLGCIADLEGDREAALAAYAKVERSADVPSHRYQKELAARFTRQAYRGYPQDG